MTGDAVVVTELVLAIIALVATIIVCVCAIRSVTKKP